ncbi:MAG TPA: SRPBCC family protein [Burkholderiaceae bacterium]|nr:SRPBCC family protein [Burkholderiaceae bacterium]
MLKAILLVVAAVIAALLVSAAFRPDSFRLARSTTIAAPPEKVFALINDLRQFNTWNPFAKKEPSAVITYDSTSAGVGGAYGWKGDKTGEGRMQIVESVPAQRVSAKLDFVKPFEAHNRVDFTIQPQGDKGSTVTWAMQGPMPYLFRLVTVFSDMDKTVGKDFDNGLADLKALAEKS